MGFFDTLLSLAAAGGLYAYYHSVYKEYDDEDLVDVSEEII